LDTVYTDNQNKTKIYTDGWYAYSNLAKYDYDHIVVKHIDGFGFGDKTTNHIEGFWGDIKKTIGNDRYANIKEEEDYNMYIATAIWRRNHRDDDLSKCLVNALVTYYNIN